MCFEPPNQKKAWKPAIRESAVSTHKVLLTHPWAAELLISRVYLGEASLNYADKAYGCLRKAGFGYDMADHAWNAINNHLYGFTLTVINAPIQSPEYASAAEHYQELVPHDQYPHLHSMMQEIITRAVIGLAQLLNQ